MTLVHRPPTRVGVIGAGLAGLTAARRLRSAGAEVVVFEARDRVGGRAYTVRDFAQGQHGDLGPEIIPDGYRAMKRLALEIGVELSAPVFYETREEGLEQTPIEGYFDEGRLIVDGVVLEGQALAEVAAELRRAIAESPAADYEVLEQWARRIRLSPAAHGVLRGISAMMSQSDLDQLDGKFLFGAHVGGSRRVVGGTQRFAEALAEDLEIRLETPVTTVRYRREVEVVSAAGESDIFDRAIIATPFLAVGAIGFDPPLPASRLAALDAFDASIGGKISCQYEEGDAVRAALTRGVVTNGPINTAWVSNPYVEEGPAVVSGFCCGTARTLMRSPEDALATLDAVVRTAVGAPVTRIGGATHDWTADAWAHLITTNPGEAIRGEIVPRVAAALGRLHFAGDYTDFWLCGTMEGAVRSGKRAADEILRRATRVPLPEIEAELVR